MELPPSDDLFLSKRRQSAVQPDLDRRTTDLPRDDSVGARATHPTSSGQSAGVPSPTTTPSTTEQQQLQSLRSSSTAGKPQDVEPQHIPGDHEYVASSAIPPSNPPPAHPVNGSDCDPPPQNLNGNDCDLPPQTVNVNNKPAKRTMSQTNHHSPRKRRQSDNSEPSEQDGGGDDADAQHLFISSTDRRRREELLYIDEQEQEQLTAVMEEQSNLATTRPAADSFEMDIVYVTPQGGQPVEEEEATAHRGVLEQATREMLLRVLQGNFLFKGIEAARMEKIINTMTRIVVEPHDVIIREGDAGDDLFVIESGVLEVVQSRCPDKIDQMEQGRVFGELALMYRSPRAATVRAATKGVIWRLSKHHYQAIEMEVMNDNLVKRIEQLQKISAFKNLTPTQLRRISAVMQEEAFQVGEVICRQGELPIRGENDKFYTISSGEVRVTVASQTNNGSTHSGVGGFGGADSASCDAEASLMVGSLMNQSVGSNLSDGTMVTTVARLKAGEWFGEMALLRDEPRTANVISLGDENAQPTKCYTLTRGAFEQIVSSSSAISTIASHSEVRKEDTNEVVLRHHRHQTALSITLQSLRIMSVIGEGGFSVVRLVQHAETGAVFALKVMNKADLAARFQQDHVNNERRILLASSHPFILSLIRTFKDDHRLYMLMELVQGGELFSRVTKSFGGLPFENVRFYAACVTDGLAYLHKKGIAYRDLKLENLVIDSQGYVKIIDFGFAKQLAPGEKTRTLCGTPDYLAPEAVTRQGHDHKVDCWGLGVLIYEMITQCSPYADPGGGNHIEVFRRILGGPATIDWRYFIRKYETKLNAEMSQPCPNKALIDWIHRDYAHTRDMLNRLWTTDPATRMSCAEMRDHVYFFPKVSFSDLRDKKIPAPWIPNVASELDTRYFDIANFSHVRESTNVYTGPVDWFAEFGEILENDEQNIDSSQFASVKLA